MKMNGKTAIMIDSGCAPPKELMRENDIEFIGIKIDLDGQEYEDGVELSKSDFYRKVKRARSFSTSPPSPKEILDRYRHIQSKGYERVVDIHFSSKMTDLYANSQTARDFMSGLDVHIIDTQSVSAGAYFTSSKIIELLKRGETIEKIYAVLDNIIASSKMFICASTLKYFVKNGRIGAAQGLVGTLMRVKPVLTIENGIVAPYAKAKGMDNAMQKVADAAFDFLDGRRHNIIIHKAYGFDNNKKYMEKTFELFMDKFRLLNVKDYKVVTGRGWPTVTCHSGPEVFAFSVYGEKTPI
jgi:DegV family protein with EDD domain